MTDSLDDLMAFNGVNGATGKYSIKPVTAHDLGKVIQRKEKSDLLEAEALDELRAKSDLLANPFPVKEGVDPNDLTQSGWGVIFHYVSDPVEVQKQAAIKEALKPLLDLRQRQVNNEKYFQIFEGARAYRGAAEGRRAESKPEFLKRLNIGYGPVDPDKGVPYYLLIVGSPVEIPYQFQFQLDVQFAVGRIHFDTPQEYAYYAASVVAAETGQVKLPRKLAFFGPESADDRATQLSSEYLIKPLLAKFSGEAEFKQWQITSYLKEQAQKGQLQQLLTGKETPALLFTASHGMEFPMEDSRQLPHQGALLCSDWPGPNRHKGKISQDLYFAGDDLTSEANLLGLITFHFACFGAGCPELDEFSRQFSKARKPIAPYSFIGGLPKGLLSHPKGGALAVIGHVERAWGYSFIGGKNSEQTTVFASAIHALLSGKRVGFASEHLNLRYAELATALSSVTEELEFDPNAMAPRELAGLWTAHNDARDYVVLGDPAAKLFFAEDNAPITRPVIEMKATVAPVPMDAPAASFSPTSAPNLGGIMVVEPFYPETNAAETAFGFFSGNDNESKSSVSEKSLATTLAEMGEKLGKMLMETIDDLTSLEVLTYTSSDLGQAEYDYDTKKLKGDAKLRAMTRIAMDGDTLNLVPKASHNDYGTQLDQELWEAHRQMVALAQTNRLEFIRALGEIAGTVVKAIR